MGRVKVEMAGVARSALWDIQCTELTESWIDGGCARGWAALAASGSLLRMDM